MQASLSPRVRTFILERGPIVRRWTLMGLAAGVPIFFLRTGRDPFNVPKLAFLIIGLSVVLAIRAIELLQGSRIEHVQSLITPAAAFAFPLLVSWVFSDHRYWGLFGLFARFQGLIPYLLAILLGLLIADAFVGHLRSLAWAIIVAGSFVGAYAVIQALGLDPFEWALGNLEATQAISTLGNPNFTGGFLGMALPVALGMWFLEPKRRSALTKLLGLILLGWVLSRSEGGWAAGLTGSLLVLAAVQSDRWARSRLAAWAAVVGIVAIMLGSVIATILKPTLDLPFTASERGQWWVAATRMGLDSPVVGHGPNSFAVLGVQYRTELDAVTQGYNYTDDPHSVPLSLFSGWGLLGVAGYGALVLWIFRRGQGGLDLIGWMFLASAVAYLVQSIVSIDELSLRVALWTSLGGLSAASLSTRSKTKRSPDKRVSSRVRKRNRPPRSLQRVPAVIAVVFVFFIPVVWSTLLVVADARFQGAMNLFDEGKTQLATREAEEALSFREEYRYRHLMGVSLGNAAATLGDEELIAQMNRAFAYLHGFPDLPALRDQARLLHEWRPQEVATNERALALYMRAMELDPKNPRLKLEAVPVALAARQFSTAEEVALAALEIAGPDDEASLIVQLGDANAGEGDFGRALDYYMEFLAISTSDEVGIRKKAVRAALQLGQFETVKSLTDPVAGQAGDAYLLGAQALALAELSLFEQAEASVNAALQLDSTQSLALRAERLIELRHD